jgi:hypothetical protein
MPMQYHAFAAAGIATHAPKFGLRAMPTQGPNQTCRMHIARCLASKNVKAH